MLGDGTGFPWRAIRRSGARWVVLAAALAALRCGAPDETSGGAPLALRDPLGTLDELEEDLRLIACPVRAGGGAERRCDPEAPDETPMVEPLTIDPPPAEDCTEVTLDRADPRTDVSLARGSYVVAVEASGTYPATGEPFAARACRDDVPIEPGKTQEVRLPLVRVMQPGECGDGRLSADEHCDDGNAEGGDGCDERCRSEPAVVSVRSGGVEATDRRPAIGWRPGSRVAISYDSMGSGGDHDVRFRMLDVRGEPIDSPSAFAVDTEVLDMRGVQTTSSVSVASGRAAFAFADFRDDTTDGGDVRLRFFRLDDRQAEPADDGRLATASQDGVQGRPSVATIPEGSDAGTSLVAFNHDGIATGLAARVFAAGTAEPSGGDAFPVGEGVLGSGCPSTDAGCAPAVAAGAGGFVVAFTDGEDVFHQRFSATGADAGAAPVLEGAGAGGVQDEPTVALLEEGDGEQARYLIAWRDERGDEDGTAIRGRIFAASDGAALSDVFVVNTTTEGAQGGPVAAAARRMVGDRSVGRFVLAWQHRDRAIRARLLEPDGTPALNREPMPSADDFRVAGDGARAPAVAAGGTSDQGLWIAAWERDGDVHRRLYPLP